MLDKDGFLIPKGYKRKSRELSAIARGTLKPIDHFTDAELMGVPTGSVFIFDVETYRNFWYVAFQCAKTGKVVDFEISADSSLNVGKLRWMLWRYCFVGFNSRAYDIPMICLALDGMTTVELKEVSDRIILGDMRAYQVEKEYKIKIPQINHIDLIEVAPLMASLKTYSGRLHCRRMQDLPFDPHTDLTREEAEITRVYCVNDLDNTHLLFDELAGQLALRIELSKDYEQDLRSKSDAQIAEAVIVGEISKLAGYHPRKPTIEAGTRFRYALPPYVRFRTEALQRLASSVAAADFIIDHNGSPVMPAALDGLSLPIGACLYTFALGGLHSNEKSTAHVADDETFLIDRDVASYYPRIILNQRLYPKHLGDNFLTVYQTIVNRRLDAKKTKNKIVADALKITINGSFGKLGSMYSTLYAPDLMLQVTISGQLSLLMLIEAIELAGIPVISGNTDGIVIKCPANRYDDLNAVILEWEHATDFETEETRYRAIYSRDVNNYIAIKTDDEVKAKGTYSEFGSALNSRLSKNPECLICSDAVKILLVEGTSLATTIRASTDIRRFVSVRNVKGGAEKNGEYLGKVVRWYYAKGEKGAINYVASGNKVAKSEGACPIMDLPDAFPSNVNYDWYINEATEMLYDIGYLREAKTLSLF